MGEEMSNREIKIGFIAVLGSFALWLLVSKLGLLLTLISGLGFAETLRLVAIVSIGVWGVRLCMARITTASNPNLWRGLAGFITVAILIYVLIWEGSRVLDWMAVRRQWPEMLAPVFWLIIASVMIISAGALASSVFKMVGFKIGGMIAIGVEIVIVLVFCVRQWDVLQFDGLTDPYGDEAPALYKGHIDDATVTNYNPAPQSTGKFMPVPESAHLIPVDVSTCRHRGENSRPEYWFDLSFDNPQHQFFVARERRVRMESGVRGTIRKWIVGTGWVRCDEMYGKDACIEGGDQYKGTKGAGTTTVVPGASTGSSGATSGGATPTSGAPSAPKTGGPVVKGSPVKWGMLGWLALVTVGAGLVSAARKSGEPIVTGLLTGLVAFVLVGWYGAWGVGSWWALISEDVLPVQDDGEAAWVRTMELTQNQVSLQGNVEAAWMASDGNPLRVCACAPRATGHMSFKWGAGDPWQSVAITQTAAVHDGPFCVTYSPVPHHGTSGSAAFVVKNDTRSAMRIVVGSTKNPPDAACPATTGGS